MSEKMYCRQSYNKTVCDQIIAYIVAVSKFRLVRVYNHLRVILFDDDLETIVIVTCPIEDGVGAVVDTICVGDSDFGDESHIDFKKYFTLLSFANDWGFDEEVYDSIINTGEYHEQEEV